MDKAAEEELTNAITAFSRVPSFKSQPPTQGASAWRSKRYGPRSNRRGERPKIARPMEMVAASRCAGAGPHACAGPYADKIPQHRGQPRQGPSQVPPPFLVQRRRGQDAGVHPRHDRQGSVRWPEHQRPAGRHATSCATCRNAGCSGGGHRQQRPGFPEPHPCAKVVRMSHLGDRPHLEADRPGQGDARRLRRRASSTPSTSATPKFTTR